MIRRKPTILQQVRQTLLGPSGAVDRHVVDSHQEGCCDNEHPAWPQHAEDVSAGPVWPRQVLENLVGYDQVKLAIERLRANVEVRKLGFAERTEPERSLPLRSGRYLQHIQIVRFQRLDELKTATVHHNADPVRRIEADFSENFPQPFALGPAGKELACSEANTRIKQMYDRGSLLSISRLAVVHEKSFGTKALTTNRCDDDASSL